MAKTMLDKNMAASFLSMSPLLLVTSNYDEQKNIITVGWSTPVSFSPPLVAMMIGHGRYSHHLIESSRQFIINIPDRSMMEVVKYCGSTSGRRRDKFRELQGQVTPMPGITMDVPLISECFAHIECMIHRTFDTGDHTVFVGSVQNVLAEKDSVDANGIVNLEKYEPIFHLGGDSFGEMKPLA